MVKTSLPLHTILIVDDQPVIIQSMSNLLRSEYRILAATSGMKALEIAGSDNRPDIIILDITMPDLDGFEVCRRLKNDPRTESIPVIFITVLDTPEDEEKGFYLGAADFISKPFKPAVVRMRVRNQIRLKEHTDLLERYAFMDGLTQLANRRNYDDTLLRVWKSRMRSGGVISLLMIDIDSFKAYNDNYGHGAGDECLRSIAGALKYSVSRPDDLVARYGGEELVALLPDTDATGAAHVAQRMLDAVNALDIPHDFSYAANHVTVSIGGATVTCAVDGSARTLVERADHALYTAKKQGGNKYRETPSDFDHATAENGTPPQQHP